MVFVHVRSPVCLYSSDVTWCIAGMMLYALGMMSHANIITKRGG
jgi:hypothetical protein